MTQAIPAIPTQYNGVQFRSRLEARWAAFFDHMRLAWEYEPELPVSPDWPSYRPDFRIQKAEVICPECLKWMGTPSFTLEGAEREEMHASLERCTCIQGFNLFVEIKPKPTTPEFRKMLFMIGARMLFGPRIRPQTDTEPRAILLIEGTPSKWTGVLYGTGLVFSLDHPGMQDETGIAYLWSAAGKESGIFADRFRFW